MKRQTAIIVLAAVILGIGFVYWWFLKSPSLLANQISIKILSFSKIVKAGQELKVAWHIDSNQRKEVDATAVFLGKQSVVSPQSSTDYPFSGPSLNGLIPGNFSQILTMNNPGTYFFRIMAVVGGVNYWSDEAVFQVR